MRKTMVLLAAGLLLLAIACQGNSSVGLLQLDFEWSRENECRDTSPQITITGLPEAAATLRVRLIDLYQPGADHGGWGQIPVPANGVIPAAGLSHFRGPCPPKYYGNNNYEFTVEALDRDGVKLAEGKLARKCCPDW
jgi:phosphatidylethanolamine-binding protein (PEBP) family uncharacterized protein